jgi:hypothetical protein
LRPRRDYTGTYWPIPRSAARLAQAAGHGSTPPRAELRWPLVFVVGGAVSTHAWLTCATEALLGSGPLWRAVLLLALGGAAAPLGGRRCAHRRAAEAGARRRRRAADTQTTKRQRD